MLEEPDQCINLCRGLKGKIDCLWYNYLRFADNGRYYSKYALLYFLPWIAALFLAVILGIIVF
jgi:hypothetical protein